MSRKTLLLGILIGIVTGWLLHGTTTRAQNEPAPLVRVDETKMTVSYVNAYRIHTSAEEVIIDVGFNMPNPNAAEAKSGDLLFYVSNRLILSYTNAKRLQLSLQKLIDRYEQQFGELPLAPGAATQPVR